MIKKLYLLISLLFSINLFAVEHDIHKQIADIRLDIQKIKLLDARDEKVKKIEALQNELDELRNKLIESRLEKEKIKKDFGYYNKIIDRQDKRIEDFNIYFFWYGILITILLFVISYVSYKFTSNHARDIVNDWLKKNKKEILEPIKEEAKEFQKNIEDNALKLYKELFISQSKELNLDAKLTEIEERTLKSAEEILNKREAEQYTHIDWIIKYLNIYKKDTEKALSYIENALITATTDNEKLSALFYKAYLLGNSKKTIPQSIECLDEIIAKSKNSTNNDILLICANSLLIKGVFLGRINEKEKSLEIYSELINLFKNSKNDVFLTVLKSALLNKIEMNLLSNIKTLEKDNLFYHSLVGKNKEELVQYNMIKILENAVVKDMNQEIKSWKKEFERISFKNTWSFEEVKTWANSFEDEKVKERLLRYIDIFENHNKNIKVD